MSRPHERLAAGGVAGIVAVAALVWCLLNVVRRPPKVGSLVIAVLLALDLGVLLVMSGLPRPSF